MDQNDSITRQRLRRAALRIFAECGYAGASVQAIVDAAKVTKPTLYYYFGSKAGLYQALIDWAHDERFHLMREAARSGGALAEQLTAIWTALFEFIHQHRELMRIAFATAFAARGEIPAEIRYLDKCERNFEFLHGLIRAARASGGLNRSFDSRELTLAIWGMMSIKVMEHLVHPGRKLSSGDAAKMVRLFLEGAGNRNARRTLPASGLSGFRRRSRASRSSQTVQRSHRNGPGGVRSPGRDGSAKH
jgi:AcrR family transcriptional regulator